MGFCKMKMGAWEYNRLMNGFKYALDVATENVGNGDAEAKPFVDFARRAYEGLHGASHVEDGDFDPGTREVESVSVFVYDELLTSIVWFSEAIGIADAEGYDFDYADGLVDEPLVDVDELKRCWALEKWAQYCEEHDHPTKKSFAAEFDVPYDYVCRVTKSVVV